MRDIYLPPPIVGIEALREEEFLLELQPALDAVASRLPRMLGQLIIATLNSSTPISKVTTAVSRLYNPGEGHRIPLNRHISEFLAPGLAIVSDGSHFSSTVAPTAEGKETMPIIGVLVGASLKYDFPVGSAVGHVRRRDNPPDMYPFNPSFRLRLLQSMSEGDGRYASDIAPLVGRTSRELRKELGEMRRGGLVASQRLPRTHHKLYSIAQSVRSPVTGLLLSLASLESSCYRKAASAVAETLLDPVEGPPLVNRLAQIWNSSLLDYVEPGGSDESTESVDLFVRQYYHDKEERGVVRQRIRQLLENSIVTLAPDAFNAKEYTLSLHPALIKLTDTERRLLAEGCGIADLLSKTITPLPPPVIIETIRRAGYSDLGEYLQQFLVPKVMRIVRAANNERPE